MYLLPLSSGFTFPDDFKPEKEKATPKYGADVGRALYSRFCLGGTYGWGYDDLSGLKLIRDYGDGVQPEQMYRDAYLNGSPIGAAAYTSRQSNQSSTGQVSRNSRLMNTNMRLALTNISYQVYSPIPKFSSTIISMLDQNRYSVECQSVEQSAIDEKTWMKMEVLMASQFTNPLAKELGVPPINIPIEVQNEEELELADKRGLFKLDIERALEKLIRTGFNLSEWDSDVRRKCNKDAIDFNFRCAKLYYEEATGAVKIRYVDVTKLVVLWNDNQTEPVAIGDIRLVDVQSIYHDLIKAGYSELDIKGIANTYQGQQIEQWRGDKAIFERKDPLTGKWTWLDFKVPVLDFEYLSTDHSQYVKATNKKGEKIYYKNEEPVSDKEKSKDREYDDYRCNSWYEGSYIVGTDKVFGWRKKPYQFERNKLNPMSSYVFDKAIDNGQALTQRVMGLEDDLMMALLKKRAAVFAAAPKGYNIDIGESGNIKIGGQEFSAFDLIHLHRQTGISFSNTRMSPVTGKTTGRPIQELENGLGPQGQEWLNEMAACTYAIANAMGITDAMAAEPDMSQEKAVGALELERIATNNAIHPVIVSDREFWRKVAEKYALYSRTCIKYSQRSKQFYQNQLGTPIIKTLAAIDHINLQGLGITMKAVHNDKQKEVILARAVEMSKIATRDGTTYLSPADVEEVAELLENDDIKGARMLMKDREKFNRREAERISTQAIEQTGQVQQQSALVAEQAKQQTNALATQGKITEIAAQGEEDRKTLGLKVQLETPSKLAQIREKGDVDQELLHTEIAGELVTGQNVNKNE